MDSDDSTGRKPRASRLQYLGVFAIVIIVFGLTAVTLWRNERERSPDAREAPTPVQLCTHILELVARDLEAAEVAESEVGPMREHCIKQIRKEREMLTAEQYDTMAACIMAATSIDAFDQCEPE